MPSIPSSSPSSPLRREIRYSQNFLRDPRVVAALLDECHLEPDSVVYEIGPGKGIMTEQLAVRYPHVVAIEKDPQLAALLRRRFARTPNVTIREGDFLHYRLPRERYQVVANIPFNITSAIVTKLTTAPTPPEHAYLSMQREAADTLLGRPRESLRTVLLKPWFEIETIHHFRRIDFEPAPRVDVVMLRLRKRGPPLVSHRDRQSFRDFVTYTFTAWQPTIELALRRLCARRHFNTLRGGLSFSLDVAPTALALDHWLELFAAFQVSVDAHEKTAIDGSEKRLAQQQSALHKEHRTRSARTGR